MVELPRETLETVLKNQEEIKHLLEKIIQTKAPLAEKEKERLLAVWWRGTLGFGGVFRLGGGIPGLSKRTLDSIIRTLVDGKKVIRCTWVGTSEEVEVTIDELARRLLDRCLDYAFSASIRRALELTPERGGGDALRGIRPV